jgi:tRNA U34 5-methylaminomethyl-2-thiouridine-forming methyltransferase MnmC
MFFTDDGSISLKSVHFDETYHSKFGAVGESMHVFIQAGLQEWYRQHPKKQRELCIFEMGFGTGLNASLALQWATDLKRSVVYHAIELFPLDEIQLNALNHADFVERKLRKEIYQIQHGEWNKPLKISPYFTLHKQHVSLLDAELPNGFFDVIFFDAFSPNVQPELWTGDVFRKIHIASRKNAILTTYSAKGEVRRALNSAGFSVEKIPGPIGKREISRATKHLND